MLATLMSVVVSASVPPADVVPQMLARIKSDTLRSRSLAYVQERTEYETRAGADRLKKIELRTVRGTGTGFLKRLTTKDGKPVANAKEEPLDTAMIELTTKYTFAAIKAPVTLVDGYECWQVTFTPRDGLQDNSDDEAILNHIRGTAYVDAHTYLVRRIHATMSTTFHRGFLGAARIMSITVDSRQMEWSEQRIGIQATTVIHIQYSVLGDTFLRIEYFNTSHRWQP